MMFCRINLQAGDKIWQYQLIGIWERMKNLIEGLLTLTSDLERSTVSHTEQQKHHCLLPCTFSLAHYISEFDHFNLHFLYVQPILKGDYFLHHVFLLKIKLHVIQIPFTDLYFPVYQNSTIIFYQSWIQLALTFFLKFHH